MSSEGFHCFYLDSYCLDDTDGWDRHLLDPIILLSHHSYHLIDDMEAKERNGYGFTDFFGLDLSYTFCTSLYYLKELT